MKILEEKVIDNDVVKKYSYCKYDSGIYHLLINTTERWVYYHRYSNDEYAIGLVGDDDAYVLNIPELEDLIPNYYLPTHIQEKDDISFYWIPYDLIRTIE